VLLCELDQLSELEFLRRNNGLTRSFVERVLWLPPGCIARYERGERPDAATRRTLAGFFEIAEDDLFPA
jgi:hypothetical protein